nr:serine hydrolase [Streptomonospora alba]
MLIHEHLQGVVRRPPRVAAAGRVAPECSDTEPEEATVYDIASLAKVVATWPLIGHAVDTGLMELDVPVRAYLPPVDGSAPTGEATVRHLLTHTSGAQAPRLDHYRDREEPLHEIQKVGPAEERERLSVITASSTTTPPCCRSTSNASARSWASGESGTAPRSCTGPCAKKSSWCSWTIWADSRDACRRPWEETSTCAPPSTRPHSTAPAP